MRGRATKRLAGALAGIFLLTGVSNSPAHAQAIRCIGGFLHSVSPGFAPFNLGVACSSIDLDFLRKVLLQAIIIGNIHGRVPTLEDLFGALNSDRPEDQEFLQQFGEFIYDFQRLKAFSDDLKGALHRAGVDDPFGPENRQRLEQRRAEIDREIADLLNELRDNRRVEQQADNLRDKNEAALRDAQNAVNQAQEQLRNSERAVNRARNEGRNTSSRIRDLNREGQINEFLRGQQ